MRKRYNTKKEINLENKIKITVLAYDDLEEYIPKNKSILIRMHIEENEDISFENNYIDVLKINVIDEWNTKNPEFYGKLFTSDNSKEIYDFFNKYIEEIEEIVIHCKAGLSRSAAIAICLLNFLGEREEALLYVHKYRAMPNRLIMETMTKYINDTQFFNDFVKEMKKRGLYRGYEDLISR